MRQIKKITALLIITMMLFFMISAVSASGTQSFRDFEGYFDAQKTASLETLLRETEQKTGLRVIVVITDNIGDNKSDSAAERYAKQLYNVGNPGILLLVNNDPLSRWNYIYVHETDNIFTSSRINRIFDDIIDYKISGDVESFIRRFCHQVVYYHEQGPAGGLGTSTTIIIAAIASVITSVTVPLGIRARYKIKKARCANEYLIKESVKYRQKSDTYIRTRVTKVKIESSSSGGRSGGGGSSGGGRRG